MKSKTILLVEDEPEVRNVIARLIQSRCKSVVTASNLAEVKKLVASNPCLADVVVLDLNLGDSYGSDTIREVRALLTDVPIIVMTGQVEMEECEAAIYGANAVILKGDLSGTQIVEGVEKAIAHLRTQGAFAAVESKLCEIKEGVREVANEIRTAQQQPLTNGGN